MESEWTEVLYEDDITVFNKKTEGAILPFKAKGIVAADIETVLSILMDHKLKPQWAPKLKSVKIHKMLSEDEAIFSEYYKTPWPAIDREFLLKGSLVKLSQTKYHLLAKSYKDDSLKEKSHIQANVKVVSIIVDRISPTETMLEFEFHGDMKGWMPVWLMNIIQKKWPLRFIQGLRAQVRAKS
ncbi:MAG: START domain-containing protein [Bdellovibrionales bacterium]